MALFLNTNVETLLAIEKAGCNNCYKTYFIDKKTKRIVPRDFPGNLREINAPISVLKEMQKRLSSVFLDFPYNEVNKGFIAGKGIKDVLEAVKDGETLIHIDLEKFFDNHSALFVKMAIGKLFTDTYGIELSNQLLNIITEIVCKDHKLPQGSPASPILVVVLNKEMDDRLEAIAKDYNLVYARYADDLSFAGKVENSILQTFITKVVDTVHPFKINFKKLGIMRHSAKPICKGIKVIANKYLNPQELVGIKGAIINLLEEEGKDLKIQVKASAGQTEVCFISSVFSELEREELNEFIDGTKIELGRTFKFEINIKPILYYIQSTKKLLGANIQDGRFNFPRKEYENLRLIAFLMGRQRAIKSMQYIIEGLGKEVINNDCPRTLNSIPLSLNDMLLDASNLLNMYALQGQINTINNEMRTNYRNLLRNPFNRKIFNGKLAHIKNIDENKYNKLVEIEHRSNLKCVSELAELFNDILPLLRKYIEKKRSQ